MKIDRSKLTTARAAELIQWLAYPLDSQENKRDELEYALYVEHLRQKAAKDPQWEYTPQILWPAPLLTDQKQIHHALIMLQRRLKERAAAGRMAMAFVKEYYEKEDFKYPLGLTKLSLDQLSEFVLSDTKESDANNVENRVWRASYPVLHLAAAAQITVTIIENQLSSTKNLEIFEVFHNPEYLLVWEIWIMRCHRALTLGRAHLDEARLIHVEEGSPIGSEN